MGKSINPMLIDKNRSGAVSGSAPGLIVLMSLQPAIPWRVGLHQWNTRRIRLDKEVRNRTYLS
jgi:hypothetical protein